MRAKDLTSGTVVIHLGTPRLITQVERIKTVFPTTCSDTIEVTLENGWCVSMPLHHEVETGVNVLPSKYGWDGLTGAAALIEKRDDEYLVSISGREIWFNECRIGSAS